MGTAVRDRPHKACAVRLSLNSVEFCWKYKILLEMDRQPAVRKFDLCCARGDQDWIARGAYFILDPTTKTRSPLISTRTPVGITLALKYLWRPRLAAVAPRI